MTSSTEWNDEAQKTYEAFHERVNMAPKELEQWLETEESKSVGIDSGDGESKGHKSGRHIVDIKRTKKDNLSQGDLEHMRRVNNYIKRHLAQVPDSSIKESRWRYSLMNWGHDPCKDSDISC